MKTGSESGRLGEFYTTLLDEGYMYAGWAKGVANGDSFAGVGAMEYLTETALMGVGGTLPRSLSQMEIVNIKIGMAQAYLDTLIAIAENSPDQTVNRDVNAREVWNFHKAVYGDNGLNIGNWTLDTPFQIIQGTKGDKGLEKYWQLVRETGGTGLDA